MTKQIPIVTDTIRMVALIPSRWRQPVRYELLEPIQLEGITVPQGFVTDGASVPRFMWWLFPAVGRYFRAVVIHDYLLDNGVTWKDANNRFKSALISTTVPIWRRRLMVMAVRVNGWWCERFEKHPRIPLTQWQQKEQGDE